jgi:hypothetical protein
MKNLIKILTVTLIIIFAVSLSVDLTLAAPKGNNGKGNGNQGQGNGNGNGNSNNNGVGNGNAGAQAAVNNSRKHSNVRANRPTKEEKGVKSDKLAKLTEKGRGRNAGHINGKENKGKGKDFFGALGRARWSYNPHDERGQGNMGVPRMRDPYGHDKDSGREKSERGRPIKESDTTTQSSLEGSVSIDFASLGEYQSDALMQSFQNTVDYYAANWDSLSLSNYYTYEEWHDILYKHFFPDSNATGLLVNHRDSIDYDLSVGDYSSDSLTVTTTLTSAQDYDSLLYTYDSETGTWIKEPISYSSGDVIFEQTQDVTLDSENNLLDYSQDLPGDIMGTEQNSAFYVELNVTVTE